MALTWKRARFILMVLGGWVLLAFWGPLYAAVDPLAAAGIIKAGDKMIAPVFELENLEGKRVTLGDYRGKVVFIVFFATW